MCYFGDLSNPQRRHCGGCYHPVGFVGMCPRHVDQSAPRLSGRPEGSLLLALVVVGVLTLTLALCQCRIPRLAAYCFLVVYGLYIIYEILAGEEVVPPLCPLGYYACL